MKNLRCKIFGHDIDDNILTNEAWYICKRCDYECSADRVLEYGLIQEISYSIQRFFNNMKYSKVISWIRRKLRNDELPF